jgi:hypothetical protein
LHFRENQRIKIVENMKYPTILIQNPRKKELFYLHLVGFILSQWADVLQTPSRYLASELLRPTADYQVSVDGWLSKETW